MLEVKITCEPHELGAHLRGLLSAGSFQGVPMTGGRGASTKEPYVLVRGTAAPDVQEPPFKVGQIVVRKREPDAPQRIAKVGAATLTLEDGSSSHIEDFEIAPPGSHAKLADAQPAPAKRAGRPAGAKNKNKGEAVPTADQDPSEAEDEQLTEVEERLDILDKADAEREAKAQAEAEKPTGNTARDPAKDFETAMEIVRKLYDDPDMQEAVVKLRDRFGVKKFSAIPDDRRTEFLESVRALEASAL